MEPIVQQFRAWLGTPAGLKYIARRVRVAAHAETREPRRLERWLRVRAPFNHTRLDKESPRRYPTSGPGA
jgi:hypothetical protein